jgi:hypothetical protein
MLYTKKGLGIQDILLDHSLPPDGTRLLVTSSISHMLAQTQLLIPAQVLFCALVVERSYSPKYVEGKFSEVGIQDRA